MRAETLSFEAIVRALVAQDVPREKAEQAAAVYATAPRRVPRKRDHVGEKAFNFVAVQFKLLCKVNDLPQPLVDYRFATDATPPRNFEIDFAWPKELYGIEVQGGIWRKGGGAHQGKGHIRDMEKLNLAQHMGWHVDQVLPRRLCTSDTVALVRAALEGK